MFINVKYKKFTDDKKPYKDENCSGTTDFNLVACEDWNQTLAMKLDEGVLLLDVDNKDEAECLLKIIKAKRMRVYIMRTDKGMHFYFQCFHKDIANTVKAGTPIGLKYCDIKTGYRNGLAFVKRFGKWREWVEGYGPGDKKGLDPYMLDPFPFWLYPINPLEQSYVNVGTGMRNDILHRMKRHLAFSKKHHEFTPTEIRQILELINEYVLSEPIDKQEVMTIAREDDKIYKLSESNFFLNKRFQHHEMAEHIVQKYSIFNFEGKKYLYNGKFFSYREDVLKNIIISECNILTASQVKEVIERINAFEWNYAIQPIKDVFKIACKNGIIDINTREIEDHTSHYFIPSYIDIEYKEDAYDQIVDKFLDEVLVEFGDKEQRMIFEEYLGYTMCLYNQQFRKLLFIIGATRNGKSTLLKMVQHLLGPQNCSPLKLFQIDDSHKFQFHMMVGKMANFDEDASSTFIKDSNMSTLKSLTSNGAVFSIDEKNKAPYESEIYAKLWIAANSIPKTEQKGKEWNNRLLVLACNKTFDEGKDDPNMERKLCTQSAKEYLFKLAINGVNRLLKNGRFTHSNTSQGELQLYIAQNDSVYNFLIEERITIEKIEGIRVKTLYQQYTNYFRENAPNLSVPRSIQNFEASCVDYFKGDIKIIGNTPSTREFKK